MNCHSKHVTVPRHISYCPIHFPFFQEGANSRHPPSGGRRAGHASPSPGVGAGAASAAAASAQLPSLKPDERAGGRCERYTGSICAEHVGQELIFVSKGLTQDYIEQKLQASLGVIANSPDLTGDCASHAIPAICLSTLPLCDRQTKKPRKVSTSSTGGARSWRC